MSIKVDTSAFMEAMKQTTARIADALGEKELRGIGFAGATIFRDEAKRNATNSETLAGKGPATRTKILRDNIIVKRLEEEGSETRQSYLVTVRKGDFDGGDAFYWRFVEDGHKFVPRNKKISKKTGKKTSWKAHRAAAKLEYGTSTVPAYPFMRPAYESRKQDAVDAMTATLQKKINEKLGKS